MATGPLLVLREKTTPQMEAGRRPTGRRYQAELVDTPKVSAQKERLVIVTHVPAPLHPRLRSVEEAALRRVRALLGSKLNKSLEG
jgi:hypothetical protein